MIWESQFWKDDLVRHALSLEKRRRQRRWSGVMLAKVEQETMLSAFSIRKLAESQKLSERVKKAKIRVVKHRAIGRPVNRLNWHKLDEHFDFSRKVSHDLSVNELANQLIHSYVFATVHDKNNGLAGFRVASDWTRKNLLYEVPIVGFIRLLRSVARDYVVRSEWKWDVARQEFDVLNS